MFQRMIAFVLTFSAYSVSALTVKSVSAPNSAGYIKVVVDPISGNKSDILFVIDNSASMTAYQAQLANNVGLLTEMVARSGLDAHAAVLTTDVQTRDIRPGQFVAKLQNRDPNFSRDLSMAMQVGVNGSGDEQHFRSVMLALSEPMLSTYNAGFLRDGVPLTIIFVTDAEDHSPIRLTEFKKFLTALKPLEQLSVYGFMSPFADNTCSKDFPGAPKKLETLIEDLNGQVFRICDPDWRAPMLSIGNKMVREVTRSVKLPTAPVLRTVEVRYGSDLLTGGDLRRGWIYDESQNSILIGDLYDFTKQPAGSEIEIKFVPEYWR